MTVAPPANIEPYVRVLGEDGAIGFLLRFGGSEIYMTTTPGGRSELVRVYGEVTALALAHAAARLHPRIPTAKPWIALVLRERGLPVAHIARKLHASDVAVRRWLKRGDATGAANNNPDQLRLL